MWFLRCTLAMWLEGLKGGIDALAKKVSPPTAAWDRYDAWAGKRGLYDWFLKDHGAGDMRFMAFVWLPFL